MIRLCATCGRRIRRWSERPADVPGSVPYGARGDCGPCYQRLTGGNLYYRLGVTPADWTAMLIAQSGRCASCGDPMTLPQVDHNHESGRVREMLCVGCNSAEGHLSGSPERARLLAQYMERHNEIERAA